MTERNDMSFAITYHATKLKQTNLVVTAQYAPHPEKTFFAHAKAKTQISFAQRLCFHYTIVRSLYFLNPKFQASSHLL